jgi:hypothetical protein
MVLAIIGAILIIQLVIVVRILYQLESLSEERNSTTTTTTGQPVSNSAKSGGK